MDEEKTIARKSFTPRDLKLDTDGEGTFEAVFATLNVIDKDGDITVPGAFGEQKVLISQYNHGSWNDGAKALPVGVGKIFERGNDAIVQGIFNLASTDGAETYKTLKFIAEKGHTQEWSYALPEIDYEYREEDGKRVRVLKKIRVPEVSPVLMGAGVNTRLLSIKSGQGEETNEEETPKSRTFAEQAAETLESVVELVKRFQEIADLRKAAGTQVSSKSTDALLRIRDQIKEIMTPLDRIAEAVDATKSDYLALKKLKQKFTEE